MPEVIVGGRPESCGYLWNSSKDAWVRPWNGETVTRGEKPEWDEFIPDTEE